MESVTRKMADPLMGFIAKRYDAFINKEVRNLEPPYTQDEILQTYRFTNVHREDDRVTRWVHRNIREPYADNKNLWFMLCVARQINWPDTLQEIMDRGGWPAHRWDMKKVTRILDERRTRGDKVYTGAYMIRAESDQNRPWYRWTKQRYMTEIVLGHVWKDRRMIEPHMHTSMRGATEMLAKQYGWGPFMAYQVAVDLQWTRYLNSAPDRYTWTALGPGSTRGLNRLFGFPLKQAWKNETGAQAIRDLCFIAKKVLPKRIPEIIMSDMQNCLCEFDKYERVKLGQGRPRAKYVPGRGC